MILDDDMGVDEVEIIDQNEKLHIYMCCFFISTGLMALALLIFTGKSIVDWVLLVAAIYNAMYFFLRTK